MCLFIVEDSSIDARLLLEGLRRFGLKYLLFRSGEALLEHICNRQNNPLYKPPSLILLDVNLPGLSGVETLQALKADPHTAQTTCVMLTASTNPWDQKRSEALGARAYFIKPVLAEGWDALITEIQRMASP